jgi:two-component system heavy metal sensor histidine kinase CusS
VKNWSLRAKLTVWSAIVVGVAVSICAVGAALYVEHEQIEALDDQIREEAEMIFSELREHRGDLDWNQLKQVKLMLPVTQTERFIEITSEDGALLYRSENLGQRELDNSPGMHRRQIGRYATRLGVFEKEGFKLCMAVDLGEINQDTEELVIGFLAGLPILLGIVILGGWWIARKALTPIRQIATAAEQITAERLDRRLPVSRNRDEIGRLATVLNEMFDRLDRSFRQAARFSADASHELKTPLTILRSSIEDLLESATLSEDDRRAVAALLEQTRRLSSITESLLLLSRADVGRLQLDLALTDVIEMVMACAEDARIMAEGRGISIETELPEHLDAVVDAGRVEQILMNLLDNAVKYNRDGGRVKIGGEGDGKGGLTIFVGNTGPGISREHAPQLFERFFRSDAVVGIPGHGLGLSLARELARAHGGDLILTRSDSEWTEFKFFIRARSPSGSDESRANKVESETLRRTCSVENTSSS